MTGQAALLDRVRALVAGGGRGVSHEPAGSAGRGLAGTGGQGGVGGGEGPVGGVGQGPVDGGGQIPVGGGQGPVGGVGQGPVDGGQGPVGGGGPPGSGRRLAGADGAGGRALLGIAGSPGAGKTTLAETLVRTLAAELGADAVAHVPMDGFHLADVELDRLGRRDRKGAPDTFDADGYAALLRRLRAPHAAGAPPIYAPAFDRDLEQPVACSIPVHPACRLVVTEGNYLLLDDPAWRGARAALDEVWFVEVDEAVRQERLLRRHVAFGKNPEDAAAWIAHTDDPNARLIEASAPAADLRIRL